jgi:hypothetical protein
VNDCEALVFTALVFALFFCLFCGARGVWVVARYIMGAIKGKR